MSQFLVPDMTCGHCVKAITAAVGEQDPKATLQFDLPTHRVRIESQALSNDQLLTTLKEAGYTPSLAA